MKTAYQVAFEIAWKGGSRSGKFNDLSALDRRLAILHVMAHLKLLESEGELGRINQGNVYVYLKKN